MYSPNLGSVSTVLGYGRKISDMVERRYMLTAPRIEHSPYGMHPRPAPHIPQTPHAYNRSIEDQVGDSSHKLPPLYVSQVHAWC